jgi:hypothetical protein
MTDQHAAALPRAATAVSIAGPAVPGEVLHLIADGLCGSCLNVCPADREDGCRLAIACPGARVWLSVGDCGRAEWEYLPWSPQDADPSLTADAATALLPEPQAGRSLAWGPGTSARTLLDSGVLPPSERGYRPQSPAITPPEPAPAQATA